MDVLSGEMDPVKLKKKRSGEKPPMVVDIREKAELAVEPAMLNAKNIPMSELMARIAEIPKDREVILVCASGSRSLVAQRFLSAKGFDVKSLAGGMAAWND
jgi:rhodanese-related sulfurtransferase